MNGSQAWQRNTDIKTPEKKKQREFRVAVVVVHTLIHGIWTIET